MVAQIVQVFSLGLSLSVELGRSNVVGRRTGLMITLLLPTVLFAVVPTVVWLTSTATEAGSHPVCSTAFAAFVAAVLLFLVQEELVTTVDVSFGNKPYSPLVQVWFYLAFLAILALQSVL